MSEPTPRSEQVLYATEDGSAQRKDLGMADWRAHVDSFMAFNKQAVLQGPSHTSHQAMTTIVHERYEQFNAVRRKAEVLEADSAESRELENVEKQISGRKKSAQDGGNDA